MRATIKARAGLLMLYGSRASGLLVALFFIPFYAKLLNTYEFGIATLVLSAQILAISFDFGMAALMARDAAAHTDHTTSAAQLRRAEILLASAYSFVLTIGTLVSVFLEWPTWQVVACIFMFLALTLQNLYMHFLLGKSMHKHVAFTQSIGVMARALFSLISLTFISETLQVFIVSQLFGATIHMLLTRWLCFREASSTNALASESISLNILSVASLATLARRGFPLFFVGIAGAITLNADKPIIAAFFGPEALAPYFLAATFSLTPIALLAGPVAQYFQPKIVKAYAAKDIAAISIAVNQLLSCLALTVVAPTLAFWIFREEIVNVWLGNGALAPQVSRLSSWLLPAAAIGAIGNIPLAIVMAAGDYTFQAKLSIALAALVLIGVAAAAAQGSLLYVCAVYIGYYTLATSALWWRSIQFDLTNVASRLAAKKTLGMVAILFLAVAFYSLINQSA